MGNLRSGKGCGAFGGASVVLLVVALVGNPVGALEREPAGSAAPGPAEAPHKAPPGSAPPTVDVEPACLGILAEHPSLGLACTVGPGMWKVFLPDGRWHLLHVDRFLGAEEGAAAPPSLELPAPTPAPVVAPRAPVCAYDVAVDHYLHAIYATPNDKPNEWATDAPTIRNYTSQVNAYLNENGTANGSTADYVYLCNGDGTVKVENEVLSTPANSTTQGSVVNDLNSRGYNRSNAKYVVWMDHKGVCACAWIKSDDRPIIANENMLNYVSGSGFFAFPGLITPGNALMHETGHTMGAVQGSSPYSTTGKHCVDDKDEMCYDDNSGNSWRYPVGNCATKQFDCGRDDYFHPAPGSDNYLVRHWNLGSPLNRWIRHGTPGNAVPEVSKASCTPDPAVRNQQVTCTFRAKDDGWGVKWSVAWGDGTTSTAPASGLLAPPAEVSFTHSWATKGKKSIVATLTDNDNAPGSSTYCMYIEPGANVKPCAPRLVEVLPSDGGATLSWTALGNGANAITEFWLYRGTSPGGAKTHTDTFAGTATSGTVSGLTNGQAYYYDLTARNGVGEGAHSNERSVTPRAASAPNAPSSFHLRFSDNYGKATAFVGWAAPSDGGSAITGYNVWRGTPGSPTLLATVGNATLNVDTSIAVGNTYNYSVSAVNALGEGPRTAEKSVFVDTPPGPPTLTATPGDTQVQLSWTVPPNGGSPLNRYGICRNTAPGQTWGSTCGANGTVITVFPPATSHTDYGVSNGVTYYYQIMAANTARMNAITWGPQSREVSAAPTTASPSPPGLAPPTSGDGAVSLAWSTPLAGAITGYKVYRGNTSGSEEFLAEVGVVNSYQDPGLTNGQKVFYQVSSLAGASESARSGEGNATPAPPAAAPAAPWGFYWNPSVAGLQLNWNTPADGGSRIMHYRIHRSTTPDNETFLTTLVPLDVGVLSYFDDAVVSGVRYYYKLSAVNAVGEGPLSAEQSWVAP